MIRLKSMRPPFIAAFLTTAIAAAWLLALHNVPKTITPEDAFYIQKILAKSYGEDFQMESVGNFDDEITILRMVQNAAFQTAPLHKSIPLNHTREPKDLYTLNHANCFDRARFIDKALRHYGLKTRYAALYDKEKNYLALETLFTRSTADRVASHAVVEALTAKGWIIIDTRSQWISLTQEQAPVSLRVLQKQGYDSYSWESTSGADPWPLLKEEFYIFYGLYSRHGQFYPPYTRYIPDINWGEFLTQNFSAH